MEKYSFDSMIELSLNEKFDEIIENGEMHSYPWVGKNYQQAERKILIIGESCYAWKNNEEELKNDPNNTIVNNWSHLKTGKFFTNTVRSIIGKGHSSQDDYCKFWQSVAFINLITEPMKTKNHRPSLEQYAEGWHAFWKTYEILHPHTCIMLGTDKNKIESFISVIKKYYPCKGNESYKDFLHLHHPKVGRYYAKTMSFAIKEKNLRFLFIKHPSNFFSWKEWHAFMCDKIPDDIQYFQNLLTASAVN